MSLAQIKKQIFFAFASKEIYHYPSQYTLFAHQIWPYDWHIVSNAIRKMQHSEKNLKK